MSISRKNFSSETMRKVNWVKNMYDDWRSYRHSLGLQYIDCDLDDVTTITEESLVYAVTRFITEVKKVDGNRLPPTHPV